MKKRAWLILCITPVLLFTSCNSKTYNGEIATDSTSIAKGKELFTQHCSACHDFRRDGIGPHLGGVTERASADWIENFIKNPKDVIEGGDERGKMLFARYNTVMPSFSDLSEPQLDQLLAYLHTHPSPTESLSDADPHLQPVEDPIPSGIQNSGLVVAAELITEIPASSDKGIRTRITKLGFIPGTERHFMVDIRGKLYELRDNKAEVYMDMAKLKQNFIDKPGLATGFGSFAFHPEFTRNGLFYTGHTEKAGSAPADFAYADSIPVAMQWVISEWRTDAPESFPFKGRSRELFRVNMVSGAHGVQEFAFDPNAKPGDENYGLLFIGIGDGSSVQRGHWQVTGRKDKALGSIFRIDPLGSNSANKQYGIPPSNPFFNNEDASVVKEIYAYGFRNPHRLSWTRSGHMLASNIGQANIESIYLIQPGNHYGWPFREGTFLFNPAGNLNKVYPLPQDEARFNYTYPIAQYDHDEGAAVIGGFEYKGSLAPSLKGKYIFGDMNRGRLFFFNLDEIKSGSMATIQEFFVSVNGTRTSPAELCGKKPVDLRLGQDRAGEIYFFSKQDGKVYRFGEGPKMISLR